MVQAIKSRKPTPEIYGLFADIISLATKFEAIQFKWIPRAKNREADAMAKQALLNATNVLNSTLLGFNV